MTKEEKENEKEMKLAMARIKIQEDSPIGLAFKKGWKLATDTKAVYAGHISRRIDMIQMELNLLKEKIDKL